ncbi:MAG TPA: hypothetical protein PLP19_03610 [bacterium]|nr:hypothetical protein [bacterium]HPN42554.1 hypothetical protein [bacterium]
MKMIYVAALLLLAAVPAFALPLTNITIVPDDETYGEQAVYSFTFTLATPLPRDGKIAFTFPSQFNLVYLSQVSSTTPLFGGFTDSPRIENDGLGNQEVKVDRDGSGEDKPVGTIINIRLGMITNPLSPSAIDNITIETRTTGGVSLDQGSAHVDLDGPIVSFTLSNPAGIVAGTPFNLSVSNAVDGNGDPASGVIRVAATSGGGEAPNGQDAVLQDITVTNGSGTASQTMYKAETGVVLTGTLSTNSSVTDATTAFTVSPAALNEFTLSNVPASITAGSTFNAVQVTALDDYENIVTGYNGSVWFSTTATSYTLPNLQSSPYTFVPATDQGRHTFNGFILRTAGNQTITVTNGSLPTTSGVIQVNAGPLASYNFTANPTPNVTAGVSVRLTVSNAFDAAGNALSVPINVSFVDGGLHASPGGQTPALSPVINLVNGTGYTDVILFNRENNLQIQATYGSLAARVVTLNVAPGNLSRFTISGYPATTVSGAAFTNPIVVTAIDVFGNTKTNYSGTMRFGSSDANASYPTTPALVSGTGSFAGSGFTLRTIGNQQLTVRDLDTDIISSSDAIQVTAGALIDFIFSVSPTPNVVAGAALRLTITNAVDAGGNPMSIPINLSFVDGGAHSSPNGQTPVLPPVLNVSNGTGYTDIVLYNSESVQIRAQSGGITETQTINVVPGVIDRFGITGYPATTMSGSVFPAPVVVTAYDVYGNQKTNYTGAVRFSAAADPLAILPGDALLPLGTQTFNGNSFILNTIGNQQITVADLSGSGVTTSTNYIQVQNPAIEITGITASQPTVTINQSTSWTIQVGVRNSSASTVTLSSNQANTYIKFMRGANDYTSQYTISDPTGTFVVTAGNTTTLTYTITQTGFTPGVLDIFARVATTTGGYTNSMVDEVYGGIEVQNPESLQIVSITPSQSTVTSGDNTHPWQTVVAVKNNGGSAVQLNFNTSSLNSAAITSYQKPAAFQDGSTSLAANETKNIIYTITQNAPTTGLYNITATLAYTLTNTGENKSNPASGSGSVTVQTPSNLDITSITLSQPSVNRSSVAPWTITVGVRNTGGASVDLDLSQANTWVRMYNGATLITGFTLVSPTELEDAGTTTLAGGVADALVFQVTQTTSSTGTFSVLARVSGTEPNRALAVSDQTAAGDGISTTVQVQYASVISYVQESVQPTTVFPGKAVEFVVTVTNTGGATLNLNTTQTTISFNDASQGGTNNFSAALDAAYNTSIPTGTTELHFLSKNVPSAFKTGSYAPQVTLNGSENGESKVQQLNLSPDVVRVGAPGDLAINAITSSATTVSKGQTNPWYVDIDVTNHDVSTMRLQSVALTFNYNTQNVTSKFTITYPNIFTTSGNNTLASGASDRLRVTITGVANDAPGGLVLISAEVNTVDQNDTQRTFSDQLFNAAQVTCQSRSDVQINNIYASQTTVTRGQTSPWYVYVKMKNNGESRVRLRSGSYLSFSRDNSYFTVTSPTVFLGSNNAELAGGATDSVRFTITQVNPAIALGNFTLVGTILYEEINTLAQLSKQSSYISARIQENAAIRLDALQTSLKSGSAVNVNQEFYIKAQVTNPRVNTGDMVKQVTLNFSSTAGFTFPNGSTLVMNNIDAGQSQVSATGILVRATNLANVQDVITANISAAVARNTNASADVLSPIDNNIEFTTQNPANFVLERVIAQEDTIVSGTLAPWTIKVAIANTGQGALLLKRPQDSDVTINREGYIIKAPTVWSDSLLTGGERDTLVYTVTNTPSASGIFTITATIQASDYNDATIEPEAKIGQAQVFFTQTSAVGITMTYMDPASPNVDAEGIGHVNVGQQFQVRVRIENKAAQALDSVRVKINGTGALASGEIVITNVGLGEEKEGLFTITAGNTQNLLGETLTAAIVHAWGQDGTQSKIAPPQDNTVVIKVYNPARLQIISTRNLGANPAKRVSQGQNFPVEVQVFNPGSEAAKECRVTLAASNVQLATVLESPVTIPGTIAGGDTGIALFNVKAGNSPATGQVNLYAALHDAKGVNSNQTPQFLAAGDSDTTFAILERGAQLAITSVDADVENNEIVANYSQNPWNLNIEIRNNGDASVEIINPSAQDIKVKVDGVPDNTYDIRPPVKLKHSGDLILRAGQTDTLAYSIAENGEIAGNAVFTALVHGRDINIGAASSITVTDSTEVYVISEAVVQIVETTINSNAHDAEGKGLVNRGQQFTVQVLVRTGQLLGVDSVYVELTSNGNSMTGARQAFIKNINRDSEVTASFTMTADSNWPESLGEKEELFSARVVSALSQNSQLPARIRPPDKEANARAYLRIQKPASISLDLQFTNPLDSVVTLNQEINVVAVVTNNGKAQTEFGLVELTPPDGFQVKTTGGLFTTQPLQQQFNLGDGELSRSIPFILKAPAVNSSRKKIRAAMVQIPLDRNSQTLAAVTQRADSIYARTSSSSLTIYSFDIQKPQGAKDYTLSTNQALTLQAIIISTPNLQDRKVTLQFPDNLPGDVAYVLNNSPAEVEVTDSPDTITWQINAPSEKFTGVHKFYLEAGALEAGKAITSVDSVTINQVVERANIGIEFFEAVNEAGSIKYEREAHFSKDQSNITLRARIKNQGEAQITGTGKVRLDLDESGLTLTSQYTGLLEQSFNQETQDIVWVVNAGSLSKDGKEITVTITQTPVDENTNEAAKTVEDAGKGSMRVYISDQGKVRVLNDQAEITYPTGAIDNIVSTEQQFTVKAVINSENVDPNRITAWLEAPDYFLVTQRIQSVPLGFNREVTWNVTAPSEPSLFSDTLLVKVSGYDINSGLADTHQSKILQVTTRQKTAYIIEPKITYPDSFQESVSTSQAFSLTGTILHTGAPYLKSDSFIVSISSPKEFTRLDNKQQVYRWSQFSAGQHPTWRFTAPSTKPAGIEFSNFTVSLLEVPRDENSYQKGQVREDSVTHKISVVDRALVKFDAYLLGQFAADTGSVRLGSEFNVVLKLTNLGFARFIDNYQIKVHLPANYTSADSVKRGTITDGLVDSLVWKIKAPKTYNSSLDIISFTLIDPPNDQYAHADAAVYNQQVTVKIQLETGKLIVENYPVRNNNVVLKGGVNVPVMGLVFRNKDISSIANSHVTKMFFTFKNREGERIDPATVVGRITAVKHSNYATIYASRSAANFATTDKPGQIMLNFNEAGSQLITVQNTERDTVDIVVDILNMETTDFKITLSDSLPVVAVDDNNQLLDLANANGDPMSYVDIESSLAVIVEKEAVKSFYNYPNPFGRSDKPTTSFIYYLEADSDIKLQIFTLTGDLVRQWDFTKTDPEGAAGLHQGEISWDGRNGKEQLVMNGVYLAYLSISGGKTATTKIAVVK